MSFTPKDSPIKLTPEQEAEINACRPEQVVPLLHLFMQQNGNARINEEGEAEVVIGPIARKLVQVVELNGEKHTVEVDASEGELGLQKAVTDLYRSHANGGQQQTQTQKRDATGKFVQQDSAEIQIPDTEQEMTAALADARQKVQLGTLTAEEFLELKQEFATSVQNTQEWAEAVQTFLQSPAGADWPGADFEGGAMNLQTMQATLAAHDMLDAEDKVAAIAGIWNYMKQTGQYIERPASPEDIAAQIGEAALQAEQQAAYEAEISNAKSASELQEINTRFGLRVEKGIRDSSGIFGR